MRLVVVTLALLAAAPVLAQVTEQQRRDCRFDAFRHCPKATARCTLKEDQQCHSAMIDCMLANRDKLQPKCSRHLH